MTIHSVVKSNIKETSISFKELKNIVDMLGTEKDKSDFDYNVEYLWSEYSDDDTIILYDIDVDNGIKLNGYNVLDLNKIENFINEGMDGTGVIVVHLNLTSISDTFYVYKLTDNKHPGYIIYEHDMEINVVRLVINSSN